MASLILDGVTTIVTASAKTSAAGASGTTAYTGDWYHVPTNVDISRIGFTCKLTNSSAGSTATATVTIEGSNDGTNAASTALITWSGITSTTDTVVLGGPIPSSLAGHFHYIRANVTAMTTTTAGSSETSPKVVVQACIQKFAL